MINNPGSAIDFSSSVPITRKINGHALSSDVTLTASDVGALSSSGTAASATKLATSRTIRTNLGSTSTASFDGTANITPGVTGTLPLANGGTGSTTRTGALSNLGAVDAQDPFMWRTVDFVRPQGKDSPIAITYSEYNTTTNVGYLRKYTNSRNNSSYYYWVKLPFPLYTNLYTYQVILECWGNVRSAGGSYRLQLASDISTDSSLGYLTTMSGTKSSTSQSISDYWPYYQLIETLFNVRSNWEIRRKTGDEWINSSYTKNSYVNTIATSSTSVESGSVNYVGVSLGNLYKSGGDDRGSWYTFASRISYRAFINSVR